MDERTLPDIKKTSVENLATEVDDALRLLDYAIAKGLAVPDNLVGEIQKASDWHLSFDGKLPDLAARAAFESAYRDLAQFTAPVTAATLRSTSDDPRDGRKIFLLTFRPTSEAKIWSRKLSMWAGLIVILIFVSENTRRVLTELINDETMAWQVTSLVLGSLEPFAYGALGAITFLLKSAHTFIYERTFDKLRVPEYYNRLLIGLISGGAIKLLIAGDPAEGDAVQEFSGAALGFIAGYNSDLLFSAIERISSAILPKVGVETVKRAGPDSQTTATVQALLDRFAEATTDEEKQAIQKLLDRLIK